MSLIYRYVHPVEEGMMVLLFQKYRKYRKMETFVPPGYEKMRDEIVGSRNKMINLLEQEFPRFKEVYENLPQ